MKKYIYLLLFSLPLLAASCSKDNYDEPQETFRGKFIDKQTGAVPDGHRQYGYPYPHDGVQLERQPPAL